MTIEEIRNRISVINAETSRLNTQRNKNIGKRETLNKQLNDACIQYEKLYGVRLTSENLEDELKSVMHKKEEELSKIEQILALINAGRIADANKLAGVEPDSQPKDSESSQPVLSEPANPQPVLSEPANPQPVLSEPALTPLPPTVSHPSSGVSEPSLTPPPVVAPPTSHPSKPVLTGVESLDMGMPALEGFSTSGLGSITPPPSTPKADAPKSQAQSFGAILNGTAFMPK